MKNTYLNLTLASVSVMGMIACLGAPAGAFADSNIQAGNVEQAQVGSGQWGAHPGGSNQMEQSFQNYEVRKMKRELKRGFKLGVCVGQTLAQGGLNLPIPTAGQQPSPLDPSVKAALSAAVKTCREQFRGAATNDSTGATPSQSPVPSSSPVPSANTNEVSS